jgi:NitT/TauT family transport system permease protein
MRKLKPALPSIAVIALLLAAWWVVVVQTRSVVFPTPGQVVTGTVELVRDGSLWEHIGASLMRVGAGFALAVATAIPLGLWMGWKRNAFQTLNPIFQILRPISPIARIPIAILASGMPRRSISSSSRRCFR